MSKMESAGLGSVFRLRGEVLATAQDEYGEITVIENTQYRILTFDRVCEQSKMQRSDPAMPVHNYIRAMLMAVAFQPPQKALVLGLGGGCLPRSLFARDKHSTIDAVELRPAVIDIARRYFSLPESDNIHYYAEDAEHYLSRAGSGDYDLIFSDLYADNSMSPLQGREPFLRSAARALASDGWLVLNYPQRPVINGPVMQALLNTFSTVLRCVVPSGNAIIYASNVPFQLSLKELQQRAGQAGKEFGSDFANLTARFAILSAHAS